jgi:hypothetical protein
VAGSGRLAGIVEIIRSADLGSGIAGQLSEALLSAARPLLVTGQARLSGHYAAPALPRAGAPPSARLLAATGRQQQTAAPAAAIKPGRLPAR